MKKYSIIGILIVAVFAFTALTGVFADNDKSQGNENKSEIVKMNAKNIKIHPRTLLKGTDAEKFKKNKKADELLAIKGKPEKSLCGPAATTYESTVNNFEGSFCLAGGYIDGTAPEFPSPGGQVEWICTDGRKITSTCIANRKIEETPILECGPAATTYESYATGFAGDLCINGTADPLAPVFPSEGGSVSWSCISDNETINCIADRKVENVLLPACGPAATTYESSASGFTGDFCTIGTADPSTPLFPLAGGSVSWNCVLNIETTACTATVEEAGQISTISATDRITTEPSTDKYAIVIGICDYPDFLEYSDICDSDGDAVNMTRALHAEYGFPTENIYLFRDIAMASVSTGGNDVVSYPASRDNIMTAIKNLKGIAGANSEVVFFFSGHGVTGNAEGSTEILDEALLVHNGIENLNKNKMGGQFEYIWDDELKLAFDGFATERITFIFDSCKAEGMNDVMEGFTTDTNGVGRVFVAAVEEDKNAYVYSTGEEGEGLFSHYFVKNGMRGYDGVGGGWADGYNQVGWDYRTQDGYYNPPVIGQDGLVVIEEAYEYAKDRIGILYSSLGQIPVLKDLFVDDLLLGYWDGYQVQ